MSHYSLWKEYHNVRKFSSLPHNEKQRILDLLAKKEVLQSYYADTIVSAIKGQVDEKTYFKIASDFILYGKGTSMKSRAVLEIVEEAYRINSDETKNLLRKSTSNSLSKLILLCDNNSIDDEVKGLRALSGSKYVPSKIHAIKFKPRLEALKKLPPVMRLKALESLTNSRKLKYNIFENISEDDFKSLLFTSSLKHTERVETVCNKYSELKYMGIRSSVKVSGCCDFCGDFEVSVTSNVVRTKTGMQSTYFGRGLLRKCCPFCLSILSQEPDFVEGN